tara:strand:- start:209 stop:913 length:705 start_codon:yes stop_codon:yes gene_type:complete
MDTIIVSATSKDCYTNTDLYKSLSRHFGQDGKLVTFWGNPSKFLDIKQSNKEGLTSVYNNFLKKYKDKDTIIFVHDDVFIDSVDFINTVNDFLHNKDFAVVGLAGGSNVQKKKPFLWHLATKKETQSGIVFHPYKGVNFPTIFGPTPKEVAVLDGLFLAVNVKKLQENNITFDEKITGFHQYDMKFCVDCKKAGLKLTTAPINVIHNSPGIKDPLKDKDFLAAEEYIISSISSH